MYHASPSHPSVLTVALSLVALAGCSWTGGLRSAAALEHGCPEDRVEIVADDGNGISRTVEVDVCGARHIYRDVGGSRATVWVDVTPESAGGESTVESEGGVEPGTARIQWSDAQIRGLVRDLEPSIAQCTGGAPLQLALNLADSGRVRSVEGNNGSTEQRQCVLAAVAGVDLPGEGRARRVRVQFGQTSAAGPPLGQTGAAEPPPPGADLATTIRQRIDAAASRLLACRGSDSAAIEATWGDSGVVQLGVRGETDVTVNECAAAAVGAIEVPAGTESGRLLHPISR